MNTTIAGRFRIDLVGQRFGRLLVLTFAGRLNKHSMFRCICDCGNIITATSNNLRRNHTKSCGCLNEELIANRSMTHGLSKHPLFISWLGMRNRCYVQSHNRYEYYGGKGLDVCDEWVDNFQAFYDWSINNGWERGLSIDRKENDRGYYPDNCKFSTIKEQNRNRTSNVKITVNGVTRILKEWSELTGLSISCIKRRLQRNMTPEEAVHPIAPK